MIWSLGFVKENKSGSKKGYELHMCFLVVKMSHVIYGYF